MHLEHGLERHQGNRVRVAHSRSSKQSPLVRELRIETVVGGRGENRVLVSDRGKAIHIDHGEQKPLA